MRHAGPRHARRGAKIRDNPGTMLNRHSSNDKRSATARWSGVIALAALQILMLAALSRPAAAAPKPATPPLAMLHAQGTQWVRADGSPVQLKGANLGNWLIPEFWMMAQGSQGIDDQCKLEAVLDKRFGRQERERLIKLFRDNWISARDWDMLPRFGLNLVRLPFIWSVLEDEQKPRQLRADAWHYLDDAIAQAEARGLYVILDLHGAVGAQGHEHHSGCAGQNLYWTRPDYQARTSWLWQQIAARYKDRAAVAGYSVLNEPWGSTQAEMAAQVKKLYTAIRAVDSKHVIILPGHHQGIDAYGKPADQGFENVAFEMHFYPGHFGWGKPGVEVHRNWLECQPKGGVCDWRERMAGLNAPLFVGEFQPWADMDVELGGQITRVSFDTYARLGWASALWAYKWVGASGGLVRPNWGLVTNAEGTAVPALDFNTAPLAEIEALFKLFGSMPYQQHTGVLRWMNSPEPPTPFKAAPSPQGR